MGWIADTSVSVPLIVRSHRAHEVARAAVRGRDVNLVVHSALETYSVLTRLPGDARLTAADAATVIAERFGEPTPLPTDRAVRLVGVLADLGISGGAVYDALIGTTAAANDDVLLTRDTRAASTYSRLNVAHEFVG